MFHGTHPDYAQAFMASALAIETAHSDLASVLDWVAELNRKTFSEISKIPFDKLVAWHVDPESGSIVHDSGKFYSIEGYHIDTSWGSRKSWEQPLINQAEVGYLGFIVKEFDGILHFLVQAKIEPGNSNVIQLSPTLQATRSNYTQIHKGRKPRYLEYFQSAKPSQVLLDQLQSEQGSRFLAKRNRNIIIKVDEPIDVHENFRWLTLGQLKALMEHDNIINMDSRTVVSGIHYGSGHDSVVESEFLKSALETEGFVSGYEAILSKLTHLKSTQDLSLRQVPLNSLQGWTFGEDAIAHDDGAFFRVIAVDVQIEGREVQSWTQPMVEPAEPGLCAFICKEINGLLHFAVQIKMECGNHDAFEFAPTVQSLEGRDDQGEPIDNNPFEGYVRNARPEQIQYDAVQAEEGGRFYRDDNRNCIVRADETFSEELPDNFVWMTLHQICGFLRASNVFNIQARSLIAALRFV
ncbi:MAG: NDP-hexose 2,3-dehydratase family protein [Lentimonas sp.]